MSIQSDLLSPLLSAGIVCASCQKQSLLQFVVFFGGGWGWGVQVIGLQEIHSTTALSCAYPPLHADLTGIRDMATDAKETGVHLSQHHEQDLCVWCEKQYLQV